MSAADWIEQIAEVVAVLGAVFFVCLFGYAAWRAASDPKPRTSAERVDAALEREVERERELRPALEWPAFHSRYRPRRPYDQEREPPYL